jgi:hypothetical protein
MQFPPSERWDLHLVTGSTENFLQTILHVVVTKVVAGFAEFSHLHSISLCLGIFDCLCKNGAEVSTNLIYSQSHRYLFRTPLLTTAWFNLNGLACTRFGLLAEAATLSLAMVL